MRLARSLLLFLPNDFVQFRRIAMIRLQMSQGTPEGNVPQGPSCAVSAAVYLKLNINSEYGTCTGMGQAGETLEGK